MFNIGIYLASEPYGGGTYQYNLSVIKALEALSIKGHKITVFCYNKNWREQVPNQFDFIVAKDHFILKVLRRVYKVLDKTEDAWRKYSSLFHPIVSKINKSSCDIVVYPSQDPISYKTKKTSLSTIHDLMHRYESHFEEYKKGEYKIREKHYSLMCGYADGILVDSEIGKKHVLESYNCLEDKVYILPFVPPAYLFNSKEVNIKNKYNLPENYLFYPAQFWEHKNHINLLYSLKRLNDKGLKLDLVLVGSKKNNYSKTMQKISELQLSSQVTVLGYVDNEDMVSLYKEALATVFVSLIGPTNIPPLEAMALGCPLICSNAYSMPNQVGDAALIVDPKDPEDISKKIETLFYDDSLKETLRQKGIDRTESYGQDQFNKLLEKHILDLLDKN